MLKPASLPRQVNVRLHAAALIGLVMLLWTAVEMVGALMSRPYSGYQIVWARYTTHLLMLLLIVAPQSGTRLIRARRPWLQIFRGLLMLGMPACFLIAARWQSPVDVFAVFWVAPLLILVFARIVLRERVTVRHGLAAAVGFAGALLILRPGAGVVHWASIFGLGMAACFSLYVVLTRLLRDEATSTNLFFTATSVLVPLSAGLPLFWQTPTPGDLALMAVIGGLGLGLLYLIDRACERTPASELAQYAYLQPVWMMIVQALLTGALPGRLALLGAALVFGSAAYLLTRGSTISGL